MPVYLCDECKKKHIPIESDKFCNLYCFHTYLIKKQKEVDKLKKFIDNNKNSNHIICATDNDKRK